MTLRRPEASEYDARYARYIDLVPEADLPEAMLRQIKATAAFLAGVPERLHDHRYAPGKWTLREVVGHIADTERILGFRLLSFARGEAVNFRRSDDELYVRNAEFSRCALASLAEEFALLRRSHVMLLRQLPEAAWDRVGLVGDIPVSARAIGYLMLGHERHHLGLIETRYLNAPGGLSSSEPESVSRSSPD
jgi:hypothetical protein